MFPGLKAIPGFNAAGSSGAGGSGSLTLTFINSSTSTGKNITVPVEAIAGDVAILIQVSAGAGPITAVNPSGWTNVANTPVTGASANSRSMVSWRVLPGGMAGTSVSGMDEPGDVKRLLLFRPSSSIVSTVSSSWNGQGTAGDPNSQTVSAAGQAAPLIVVAVASAGTGVPAFTTETPSMTNLTMSNASVSMRVGYTVYNSSPSNQSIDTGDNGGLNILQSGFLRFT